MGKSKNASYVDKSNFQLFKEKFKEKSVNQKLKNDKNGMDYEREKKKKKNFLSKWLTSIRGSWSCGEARPSQEKSQIVATKSLEGNLDLYESLMDPERKISKIFIDPTKAGLKAVIAEYRGSSSHPEELFPNKKPALKENLYGIGGVTEDENKIKRDSLKTHTQSLAKNFKLLAGEKEPRKKIEPLLTSALFIHKDIDRMVESAVFMEPNLPRDYTESKLSDEISQKSLRINNLHVSYKGKKKDEMIKTFKTTSEPTWEERKKIIHQQRLKENINYLVKQFVYLEAQDVIDYSRLESNGSARKQRIRFNNSSSGSNARDLSREVSPEILVNIKPFKEYVPENIANSQNSAKNPTFAERQNSVAENRSFEASETLEVDKVSEKRPCPVLKPTVTFQQKNDSADRIEESILTLSPEKDEVNTSWKKDGTDDLDLENPSYSFWDVYETYSTCKNLLQVEVELGNTSFQFKQKKKEETIEADAEAEEEILRNSKSLDEVLNTLEDGDHDLIFQRNMSQFKKKISVMPRLDFRKSSFNANKRGPAKMDGKVWRNLIRMENPLEMESSAVKKVARLANFSLENSRENKIEICRSECVNLQAEVLRNSEKILETAYLCLWKSVIIKQVQVLATRVEAKTLSLYQSVREVHDIQKDNVIGVIEIENATNFEETLKKIELFSTTPALIESQESKAININQNDLEPRTIMKTGRCASESFLLFSGTNEFPESQDSCDLNLSTISIREAFGKKVLELPKQMRTEDKYEKNKARIVEVSWRENNTQTPKHPEACGIVVIINHPCYEYTTRIYEKKFTSSKLYTKSYSEPDMFNNLVIEKRHQSDSAISNFKTDMARAEFQVISNGNMCSNASLDDFHGYYNLSGRKSLNDHSESTSIPFNAENKGESEGKIPKLKERMLKETDISLKSGRILKHKSNSSPEGTIFKDQFQMKENHLLRKSHVCLKEAENKFTDLVHCRKKKLSEDGTLETKRTESGLLDSEVPTPTTEEKASVGFQEKPILEDITAVPKPLTFKQGGEMDRGKMFVLRKNGTNVKKEVVAAVNLIKDLNPCKGEDKGKSKQISLVILLSRN